MGPAVAAEGSPALPIGQPVRAIIRTMSELAPLRIESLVPARCADYLAFFDHERGPAFTDNPAWARCYCHFHEVAPAIDWSALDGEQNRLAMEARIACAEMEGYLAYRGDAVAGWLNAQPRHKLPHAEFHIGMHAPPPGVPAHEAAMIVCFVVAPAERGRGVARALLAHALQDLADRGVRVVDAYPLREPGAGNPQQDHYRGPRTLFEREGFAPVATGDEVVVMRKVLQ
jgi:GNAT superfamily N-acetyltransferase